MAQTSTTIVQTVDVQLVNVIKIKFESTGTNTGTTVQMNLGNMNQLMNGVESTNHNLVVNTTKNFNVNVKSSSQYFAYTGTYNQNNQMAVNDVLQMRINQNNTGGSIGNGYNNFNPIQPFTQNIINGGTRGQNKIFRIRYLATPGLEYPAGNYLTSIIFTATQI